MCGIYGGTPLLLNDWAGDLLRHRGPNQQGRIDVHSPGGLPVLMGETRLSVVYRHDVPTPMARDGAVISYNGEVYNWQPLREELEELGYVFETPTDTEVVLCAYLEWGPACLDRLNGMFAMAIWNDGRLFLARDRLGKKPLFYTRDRGGFAFASELKCFRRLDFAEVPICQALEFYFDEYTPFENVQSVRPGEFVAWEADSGDFQQRRWWTFPAHTGELTDEDEALNEFLDVFQDACAIRKLADVPVTVFLSGGVDSSLIQATLGLDTTYTVQFEEFRETIDEEAFVQEFARVRGFEARIVRPTKEDFLETFPDLARFIEFPVGSLSVLPLYCISRQARADGFVVALSGEGSDELFNGYYRHELLLGEDARLEREFGGPYGALSRRYFGSSLERFCRMASRKGTEGVSELVEFFAPSWSDDRSMAQNLSVVEATVFLQALLVMADRLSMGNSLEVRNPFLDHRIVDFSARLSDDLKFRDGHGKHLLRLALRKLVGDDLGITKRSVKHGLPAPVNQWLFRSEAFDRKDWNHVLLGECLKQLALAQDGRPEAA
jgi:asparagine synthase (glutamine-hydrolysing)